MCYHPNPAGKLTRLDGSSQILFGHANYIKYRKHPRLEMLNLPCGKCLDCRLKYSRQWALRCVAEAKDYDNNQFITLTMNDAVIKYIHGPSLDKSFFPLFMKRLRKRFGNGIRYYMCGEYGEQFARPHYHALIFNHSFDDLVLFKKSRGVNLYRSMALEKLWSHPIHKFPYGYATVGECNFDTAAYVARYCMKKVNGKLSLEHYKIDVGLDEEQCIQLIPEYASMSRRPGLGRNYYDTYRNEIYVTDSIIAKKGLEVKPPRYYDSLYEIECPEDYARIKEARVKRGLQFADDSSPERLAVREKVHQLKADMLIRSYEKGDMK